MKGSFTDAHTDRTGKFEAADKSTLFLDEIGNLPSTEGAAQEKRTGNRTSSDPDGQYRDESGCGSRGKTGTAQNRGHDHSVFMGFAPMHRHREYYSSRKH